MSENADRVPARHARADESAGSGAAARCLVLMNPHSRHGDSSDDELLQLLQSDGFDVLGGRSFNTDLLADLLRQYGAEMQAAGDRILVGGGDGTLNRLLPQLLDAPVPVGILPLGTANDLARTLGLPLDVEGAVHTARHGVAVKVDLGRVNGQLFANVASMGLGPQVTARLSARLKERLGTLGYPRALLGAYRDMKPFRCRISVDGGREQRVRAIHVAVGNGRHYGGGATIEESAAIDDNRLDLYALSPMPLWRLLLLAPWLRLGHHREIDDVKTLKGRQIRVRTSRRLAVSADGEIVTRTPAQFDVLAAALSVMVPRDQPGGGVTQLESQAVRHDD